MHRAARHLRQRVGHRGSALLFFALLDLAYCGSLLFPPAQERRSESLTWLASILPLWVWAVAWGATGAVCLAYAARRRDQVAYAMAISLKVLWGLVSLGGWLVGAVDRGWLSAVVWLALAGFTAIIAGWPEPAVGWKERAWTQPSE